MDYMSTIETLEGLSNALARHSAPHVRSWGILCTLVKVRVLQISHSSEQGALFTLLDS